MLKIFRELKVVKAVNMLEEENEGVKKELSIPYLVRFGVKSGKN